MDLNHNSTDIRPLIQIMMDGLSRRLRQLGAAIVRSLSQHERPFGGL